VFDGQAGRPYVEDDVPNPLSVYGATQAEAERRVLTTLPQALVIRTSACFDAWDTGTFLDRALQTLRRGGLFQAAADVTVSPTYLPDLADASLDLLIDSAHGLWHLANDAETTWLEFARMAARRAGEDATLVVATEARGAFAGPRPVSSALATRRGRLLRSLDEALDAWAHVRGRVVAVDGQARCASSS
jgi:dTDP-4-dehydrorhamnose reductase